MFMRTPVHCRPRAYERLHAQLPVLESPEALLHGALAIAMHESGEFGPDGIEQQLQRIADTIRGRVRRLDHVEGTLAHAHAVFFDELGFVGNREDYHHPDNSYLPRVLPTRQGLPITLVLVYKLVLDRVGLTVQGINTPGHFLAGVRGAAQATEDRPDTAMIIDVFDRGRLLRRAEVAARVEQITGQSLPDDTPLPIATNRQWLVRLCANLAYSFSARGQGEDAAAMRELIHLLHLGG